MVILIAPLFFDASLSLESEVALGGASELALVAASELATFAASEVLNLCGSSCASSLLLQLFVRTRWRCLRVIFLTKNYDGSLPAV
jgi:hypothetical protein